MPEVAMPDQWHLDLTGGGLEPGESTNLHEWWETLGDPLLNSLIHRASQTNLDLEVALARIGVARAQAGIAGSERFPTVSLEGNAQRARASEDFFLGGQTNYRHSVGLQATWEIDVWGRITRSIESADARVEASVENYRDVLVLLFAEVALNYVDVRSQQLRIRYIEQNVTMQKDTLGLTQDRFNAQLVSELDVRQAELNVAETEALLPELRIGLAQAIHRLGVLLGEHPDSLYEELMKEGDIPDTPPKIGVGVPFELLRQRPDIRGAERRLAAQTAQIGVATADLYPRFSLAGGFGFDSLNGNISSLFTSANRSWSIGIPFQWNLFAGGAIRNNIAAQEALTDATLASYKQTVLIALEEVENSLVSYVQQSERKQALDRAVTAAQQSVTLVDTLYRTGVTNFQNVLDMQRSLVLEQDNLAATEGNVVRSLILLYLSLGGGWDPQPEGPPGSGDEGEDPPR